MLDRRRSVQRTAARDGAWFDHIAPPALGRAACPRADQRLIALQALAALAHRIEGLGDPTATIFRRHRIEGEAQRRIAEDLNMGLSTVEKHLRKAYAAISDLKDDLEA